MDRRRDALAGPPGPGPDRVPGRAGRPPLAGPSRAGAGGVPLRSSASSVCPDRARLDPPRALDREQFWCLYHLFAEPHWERAVRSGDRGASIKPSRPDRILERAGASLGHTARAGRRRRRAPGAGGGLGGERGSSASNSSRTTGRSDEHQARGDGRPTWPAARAEPAALLRDELADPSSEASRFLEATRARTPRRSFAEGPTGPRRPAEGLARPGCPSSPGFRGDRRPRPDLATSLARPGAPLPRAETLASFEKSQCGREAAVDSGSKRRFNAVRPAPSPDPAKPWRRPGRIEADLARPRAAGRGGRAEPPVERRRSRGRRGPPPRSARPPPTSGSRPSGPRNSRPSVHDASPWPRSGLEMATIPANPVEPSRRRLPPAPGDAADAPELNRRPQALSEVRDGFRPSGGPPAGSRTDGASEQ